MSNGKAHYSDESKDSKKKVAGENPDLLDGRVPYDHMAEFGRYEEGSPVATEVEKNMRAIRTRMSAPPKAQQDDKQEPETFMEAAKRRISITINLEV